MSAPPPEQGELLDPRGGERSHHPLAWLRRRVIRRQPSAPTRRRPGDVVRVVVAAGVIVGLAYHAHHPTGWERAFVHVFGALPHAANTFVLVFYNLLALWAVALLAGAVLVAGRWRLARDLAVAAGAAWVLGRLVAFLVQRTDFWKAFQVTFDLTNAPRYPLVRVSMAVAAIVVASPHLTRPIRQVGQVLVLALALSAMYVGRAYPTDLLGALVLGWGVAAAVHFGFGTSDGRPGVQQATAALTALGVPAWNVELADQQPTGRAIFLAEDAEGPLRITVLGRDEADTQFLQRTGRYLNYKDAPAILLPTRRQQVEYEAYVHLLAAEAGAMVPRIVFAGATDALAVLVEREPRGRLLAELETSEISDALLARLWTQLLLLRGARIAHGKLDGHHLVIDHDDATVVGFEYASTSSAPHQTAADVAELLAETAARAGSARAIAAAVTTIGSEPVTAALPLLQAGALSGWTHDAYGDRSSLDAALEELRTETAHAVGTDPPELRQMYRVRPRTLLMALGALAGVGALLSRIGSPAHFWHEIQGANPAYVALAVVLAVLADVVFGITFLGNVPIRIPIWPSIELQIALSFSNLAVPVAADAALQVRFLQKNGMDLASATATGGVLSSVSELIVTVGLFLLALRLAPDTVKLGRIDTAKLEVIALIVVFAVGVVIAVAFSIRQIRRLVLPPLVQATRTVWEAVKTPGRLALLIVGNVITQFLYAGALLACLAAFGASVHFWTLLAINIGVGTIASLVPIPGGGTAVKAVGLAGMLTAAGVPQAAAAAAVLTNAVAVSYLPAIPGWFATNDMIRRGLL